MNRLDLPWSASQATASGPKAARNASSPTLARRFPVGPGDAPLPAGTSTARTRNLHSRTTSFPRLARRISVGAEVALQDDGQLEAAVERDRDGFHRGVAPAGSRVRAESLFVGENVVGDHERARLELVARRLEVQLVVILL